MIQCKQKNVKIRASDQCEETGSRTEWVNDTGRGQRCIGVEKRTWTQHHKEWELHKR